MKVFVFIEVEKGKIKRPSIEAVCYACARARALGASAPVVLSLQPLEDAQLLGKYGIERLELVRLGEGEAISFAVQAKALASRIPVQGDMECIVARSLRGEALTAFLSVLTQATAITGIMSLPEETEGGCVLRRSIYTGKAFEHVKVCDARRILCIQKNAIAVEEGSTSKEVVLEEVVATGVGKPALELLAQTQGQQEVSLSDADVVVSGGRGMKGAENWHLLEDLAQSLDAAMACSKPVSDMEWRPHHEHVGQTGLKVSPKLYIAVGISGAIQHLAGVSNSKVIVVINKDAEAPFFQAADYGVVGDAMEVLPRLSAALRRIKE